MAKDGVRGPAQSLSKLQFWASSGSISAVPSGSINKLAYNSNGS